MENLIIERKKKGVSLKIILSYTHQEKKESRQEGGQSRAGEESRKRPSSLEGHLAQPRYSGNKRNWTDT